MNLKEAIKILAQFEELFGDGSNGGNGDDGEKKEIKWQFPEAWETEVVEADWNDISDEIEAVIKEVGDDPNEILNWGIKNRNEKVIKWALENVIDVDKLDIHTLVYLSCDFSVNLAKNILEDYIIDEEVRRFISGIVFQRGMSDVNERRVRVALENGADINKLDKDMLIYLCSHFSVGFISEVVENYVTNEEVRRFICSMLLRRGIWDVDERGVKVALENGVDINKLDTFSLWELGDQFSFDFIKEIEEKYVTSEEVRQVIYEKVLRKAIERGDEDVVGEILATKKVDVDKLGNRIWGILAYEFPTDFLKKIISNCDVKGEARRILLKEVFYRGLEKEHQEDVIWALKNGVEVDERNKKKLNTLLGPDWGKYLRRR